MIPKDTSGPAFHIPGLRQNETFTGMTLRDYFAVKAMQGDWAAGRAGQVGASFVADANRYYRMADAMMKARAE